MPPTFLRLATEALPGILAFYLGRLPGMASNYHQLGMVAHLLGWLDDIVNGMSGFWQSEKNG